MATRADHRRQTLLNLSDAAIASFEQAGSAVTIDEIARRAGVSRRTVFRWVDAKEELAFIHPVLWLDVFEAALAEVDQADDGEVALVERLRRGSRAIAEHIDADPEPPRRAFAVVAAHPELRRGYGAIFQHWIDRVAAEVVSVIDEPTATDHFRARVIGSAVMGMVDAVTRQWMLSPPTVRFVDLYDQGFALVAPLLAGMDPPG